jgi:shikimate kinase
MPERAMPGRELLPETIRRIVLTGFMGAGKTTTGALLAQSLGWRFIDSDLVIEREAGRSIAEIFAEQGEAAFRSLEAEIIRVQAIQEYSVLALGGGAIESALTREVLDTLTKTKIVFLDAPLDIMVERCLAQPNAAERPVLTDRDRLKQRFVSRLPHYRQAHLTISTAGLSPNDVVVRILSELTVTGVGEPAGVEIASEKGLPIR